MAFSERTAFQIAVLVGGLVPVGAGAAGVALGVDFMGGATGPDVVSLDSHVRYLSGLLLGIGIAFWAAAPRPEAHTTRFRLLTAIVFLGGLARLQGVLLEGAPSIGMRFGLVMELIITPALCLWQARIARQAAETAAP